MGGRSWQIKKGYQLAPVTHNCGSRAVNKKTDDSDFSGMQGDAAAALYDREQRS